VFFCATFWTSKSGKRKRNNRWTKRKLQGIPLLSMGFAVVLSNGPNPEIMLAIVPTRCWEGVLLRHFLCALFLFCLLVLMNANALDKQKVEKEKEIIDGLKENCSALH